MSVGVEANSGPSQGGRHHGRLSAMLAVLVQDVNSELWSELREASARLLPTRFATCFALLLGASWALASAGPAAAVNTYTVFPCSGQAPKGITTDITNPGRFEIKSTCEDPNVADHFLELIGFETLSTGPNDHAEWDFKANSEIKELAFDETFVGTGTPAGTPAPWDVTVSPFTNLEWRVFAAPPFREVETLGNTAFHGHVTAHSGHFRYLPGVGSFPDPANEVSVGLECRFAPSCAATPVQTIAVTRNIEVVLADPTSPTIKSITPPDPTKPLRGTVKIPYKAEDTVSGFAEVFLDLDLVPGGSIVEVGRERDCNAAPYGQVVPCPLSSGSREVSLDTTQIPDGVHTITASFLDAAENSTRQPPFTIKVHNAPTNLQRPALGGTAKVGEKLSVSEGQWEASADPLAYQWLRCPAGVADKSEAGCTQIVGATALNYLVQAADVGKRLVAKVTAANPHGSESALSPPSAPAAEKGGGGEEHREGSAPQTKISKHPHKKTAQRKAMFSFSSDQPGSIFQCKLDKGPFKSCRSPFKHKVKRGRHSFQVRAVNSAGNADPTPAKFSWKVS